MTIPAARTNMFESKWISVAGIILLLGVAIFAIVMSFKSVTAEPETIRMIKWLACSSCGYYYKGDISNRPARCPKCGEKRIWPAKQCAKCGAIVSIDIHKYDTELRDPYCLKCGSEDLVRIDSASDKITPSEQ